MWNGGPSCTEGGDGNAVAAVTVSRPVNPQKTDLLSLDLNLIPKLQVMLQDMGMGGPRKEVTEQVTNHQ